MQPCLMRRTIGSQWVAGTLAFLRTSRNTFCKFEVCTMYSELCTLEACAMHGQISALWVIRKADFLKAARDSSSHGFYNALGVCGQFFTF